MANNEVLQHLSDMVEDIYKNPDAVDPSYRALVEHVLAGDKRFSPGWTLLGLAASRGLQAYFTQDEVTEILVMGVDDLESIDTNPNSSTHSDIGKLVGNVAGLGTTIDQEIYRAGLKALGRRPGFHAGDLLMSLAAIQTLDLNFSNEQTAEFIQLGVADLNLNFTTSPHDTTQE